MNVNDDNPFFYRTEKGELKVKPITEEEIVQRNKRYTKIHARKRKKLTLLNKTARKIRDILYFVYIIITSNFNLWLFGDDNNYIYDKDTMYDLEKRKRQEPPPC